jgi:hypothetical protein
MVFGSFDYDFTFSRLWYLVIPISPDFSLFPMRFHLEGCMDWHIPNSLKDSSESQTENNERAKSQGTLPGSQHYKEGRGACQSSGMGLGRNDKLQSLTQTCTKPTQNG